MSNDVQSYSLPYYDLIMALRISLKDYFESHERLKNLSDARTELDSRRLTIVLLTAALCESCINTWLALNMDKDGFSIIEKASPADKWSKVPKLILKEYRFPSGTALHNDLLEVFRCRDSIMHQKSEVKTKEGILHKGNHDRWENIGHDKVEKIASLPISLLEHLAQFDHQGSMTSAIHIHQHLNQYLSPVGRFKPKPQRPKLS